MFNPNNPVTEFTTEKQKRRIRKRFLRAKAKAKFIRKFGVKK